jgi:DNA excision repair protein ERCC-4
LRASISTTERIQALKIRSVNEKVGTQPKFEVEFPRDFILVVDTREQDALFKVPMKGLVIVRDTIPSGDYSIRGFEDCIAIERKSVNDLYGSVFTESESSKLIRISLLDRKWLLIEGTQDEVLSWQYFSTIHPNSMRGKLVSIEVRLGIPVHYEPDRHKAERWIVDRLVKFYKTKREVG